MKTKPKLIRVLAPPVSVMMMQHQQHEHEGQLQQRQRQDADANETTEILAMASRDALSGSLVHSRPLAPFAFETPNIAAGYKVQNVALHPCKSWTTYTFTKAAEESSGVVELGTIGTFNYSNTNDTNQNADKTTWVVVQDTQSRQIVLSVSLAELMAEASSNSESLGSVTQLSFLDQSTLYWNGFAGNDEEEGETMANKRSWTYLMIHCPNRILIVDLKRRGRSNVSVVADISPRSIFTGTSGAMPSLSSNAVVAVSRTRLLLAFTDGSLKIYDWNTKKVVQSVQWSSAGGKASSSPQIAVKGFTDNPKTSDAVVVIIPANPYSYDPKVAMAATDKKNHHQNKRQMVVCLTKKEVAYLVDVRTIDRIPPLAKMEGGSVSTTEEFRAASMEHISARYDAFRDLFFWMSPSKNNKSKLLVWDLSTIVHNSTSAKRKPEQLPIQADPVLVAQFSYEGVSHAIFPGWLHKSFPTDTIACLVVTKDGELQVSVAPLYGTDSTIKNPFLATDIWSVKLPQVMMRDLHLSDAHAGGEMEAGSLQPRFRVQSIKCEALKDPSTLYVGTTIGIQTIRLLDGLTGVASPGTRFVHLDANAGNMGKSVISVQGAQLCYSPLDSPPRDDEENNSGSLGSDRTNPIGKMEYHSIAGITTSGGPASNIVSSITGRSGSQNSAAQKLTSIVYESPPPLHLPLEIRNKRGSLRSPPQFLTSPSGRFVCCFWTDEMRYEVLSVPMMLDSVTNRNRSVSGLNANNPLVAGGTGITSFAWIGDDDVFCLLYDPEQDEALKAGVNLGAPEASSVSSKELYNTADMIKNLGKINTYKKGAKAFVDTAGKLKSVEGLLDLGKDTGKLGVKGFKGMSRLAQGSATVVAAPLKVTVGAGMMAVKETRRGAKKVSKKMPFAWGKKRDKKGPHGSLANADIDDDEPTTATAPLDIILDDTYPNTDERPISERLEKKVPWVELRMVVGSKNEADDSNAESTTVSSLGQLNLRTGNRNPPTILFGGPVLCVGSRFDENDEGVSYFYTKKKGQEDESASIYVSSGPAFPCPDIVAWDDDGRLCAIVIKGRISVYLSDEPNFIMLGSLVIDSSLSDNDRVISIRFIHGVLYCTTKNSIRCIFLGDLSCENCHLDSFTLASSHVPILPTRSIVTDYESLTPPTVPMPLHHPEILGYQSGSIMVSTTTGVVAIPLGFPLLRIGALVSAGREHFPKAEMWFNAVPDCDHDALARFLERRGVPELALNLNGICLETIIDISMRYGFVDRLEEVLEVYGLDGLRATDQSRGASSNIFGPEEDGASLVVCVGAYLLSYGKVELVRRLATECLAGGEEGRQDAFWLAGLLLSVDEQDSKRVIQRSVENVDNDSDWVVGSFVRKHIL